MGLSKQNSVPAVMFSIVFVCLRLHVLVRMLAQMLAHMLAHELACVLTRVLTSVFLGVFKCMRPVYIYSHSCLHSARRVTLCRAVCTAFLNVCKCACALLVRCGWSPVMLLDMPEPVLFDSLEQQRKESHFVIWRMPFLSVPSGRQGLLTVEKEGQQQHLHWPHVGDRRSSRSEV